MNDLAQLSKMVLASFVFLVLLRYFLLSFGVMPFGCIDQLIKNSFVVLNNEIRRLKTFVPFIRFDHLLMRSRSCQYMFTKHRKVIAPQYKAKWLGSDHTRCITPMAP